MRSIESTVRTPVTLRSGTGDDLQVDNLDVYYGQAHALQGVSLSLGQGVLAVVGRNGMGKTTLCKAITGMVAAKGSVRFAGQEMLGVSPDQITRLGIAYVPQGRRVWRSLTVDETLRLASKTARQGAWTVERVYQVFPRLAERRNNGGAQLSGGEQQMLAIGRALLFNPKLLVMDEPTEGLAPVIVEQVATLLKALADERSMSVLLIEQNLGVALEVADQVAIMVNGRIAHCLPAAELAADRTLQQRLLGLKAGGAATDESSESPESNSAYPGTGLVQRVVRFHDGAAHRWTENLHESAYLSDRISVGQTSSAVPVEVPRLSYSTKPETTPHDRAVYLAGAWGGQQRELAYVRRCLEQLGARVVTVDIAGTGFSSAQVGARELLRHHTQLERHLAVSSDVVSHEALAEAFPAYLASRRDLGALLVLSRAETATVACAGALSLPAGLPKMLVTDEPLAGTDSDVLVMTAPIGEFNRVSETLLAHAASATVGMLRESSALHKAAKPMVCITCLDLLSSTVRHVKRALGDAHDCLILDMSSTGGATLARLAKSGLIAGVIDLAPMDVSRGIVTDDDRAVRQRFEALKSNGVPYLLVPSMLEVAVFSVGQAVPGRLLQREVLASANDGSIVPVSRDEANRIADWLSPRLDGFDSPVQLFFPQPTAVSLQKLGGGTQSVELQNLLHKALMRSIKPSRLLQLMELPNTIHDPRFGEALGTAMRELIQNRACV